MEKGSDSVLPYLGLEGLPDHPGPQGSSGRETLFSSLSSSPATKESTLRPKEISREISYRAVPMESRRSQLPREPPEPDDLPNEVMRIEERLSKKRHSRMPGLYRKPMPLEPPQRSIGLQSLGDIIDEHLRLHSDGGSQAASPSPQFATTAPLRILHRGSPVPDMPMIRGHGQGRKNEVSRDSVLELLEQFPSPISTSSLVTPSIGYVSLVPSPPSSPSDTPIVPVALASLNSGTFSKISTHQRGSEMPLFLPLSQESEALQEQGNRVSHDEHELVQFFVPDGLTSGRRVLARPPSNLSSSSQGGVSDIRPQSHWTAEEEALLDEYRCRSAQESHSDSPRATRDSPIIFYNPFAADGGDDEEDEEDLPIEALRKRLKLTSTLLPQALETMSLVLNPTIPPRSYVTSTEGPGLAGIGCGPRSRSHSPVMPSRVDINGSPRFSLRALSTMSPIISTAVLSGYCPSLVPSSLANTIHDEPNLKRWAEVPLKECLPVDFELALGGTSRYPAFPSSPPSENRRLAQLSPSVPSSLMFQLPSPKLDNPTGYSQKKGLSKQTLISNSKCLSLEGILGVKVRDFTGAKIPSCLPGVFGYHEAENTAENDVQTTEGSHGGSKRARRALGASNWRPPTCWEMPEWEPAIELIGERGDQGHTVAISPPLHRCEASCGSVDAVLALAPGSRAIFIHTPGPPISSPLHPPSKMSPKLRGSTPLVFTQPASHGPHPNNF